MAIPRQLKGNQSERWKKNNCNRNISEPLKGNSLIKISKYEKMKIDWKEIINFSTGAHTGT